MDRELMKLISQWGEATVCSGYGEQAVAIAEQLLSPEGCHAWRDSWFESRIRAIATKVRDYVGGSAVAYLEGEIGIVFYVKS